MHREPLLEIELKTIDTAAPEAAEMLKTAKARLGFIPNMYGYMANDPAVLGGYMLSYDAFRLTGGFTPAEQEVIFLTISRINGCSYCLAAHSMIADKKSGVPGDSLPALREGRPLPDAKLEAVARFTAAMVETRGNPGKPAVDAFLAAGYTSRHALAVVVAIACKTFSNMTNHLAGTAIDAPFQPYAVTADA
jgi:uncharacterized peroxidase-related enzyme